MSEISFPDSWAESSLSSLISIQGLISDGDWVESKDQDPSGLVRLIQLADIGDGDFRDKSDRYMTHDKANALNCTYLKQGDVLIARMPDPLGRACIFPGVNQDAVTVVDVCLIRTGNNSAMSNELLKYWINSPVIRSRIELNASGTTRKRITRKKLEEFNFPVPPLAEQQVIADKLDTLLAQVESIKARLERIPEIFKQFRQSVLAAAMSGKLTEEWRASNPVSPISKYLESLHQERLRLVESKALRSKSISYEQSEPLFKDIPESWSWTSFSQIAKHSKDALKAGPFGSALKKSDCTDSGFRVYGQEQVIAGNESLVTYYISADKYKELESCAVQPGDILISLVGTIGKVLILSDNSEAGIINPRLVKLSLQDQISRDYIKYYLDSPVAHDFFKGFSHGGTMEILNLGILKGLPIPLPPVEEQRIVVSIVENLFAKSEIVEQQVQSALDRVNNLTQSILAKAFRGELTAEWREANPELISGENSAEALLKRIKAERESAKPTTKRGRGKA